MPQITIQVLEGLERGRCFEGLNTPVSIGREEENSIRLNDERVSRFHAKLQEDAGRVILTDLDSTNGTRVNGRPVQMRVLRPGDQVAIGRCLLLYGSRDEIIARAEKFNPPRPPRRDAAGDSGILSGDDEPADGDSAVDASLPGSGLLDDDQTPGPPAGLTAGQRAQLSDLLDHVHDEIRRVLLAGEEITPGPSLSEMRVSGRAWQRLLRLGFDVSVALRKVSEPDPPSETVGY